MKCPICGGRMLYDSKRDEYYCSVCGYTMPANTPHPPRPSEDEIGYYTGKSYQSVDMNLGGSLSNSDLNRILKNKKVLWGRSIKYILSSYETKTFRDNINFMSLILNNLKNELGYKITRLFEEEYNREVTKIATRFEHEQMQAQESVDKDRLAELFNLGDEEEEEEEEVEQQQKKKRRVVKKRNYNTFYVFLAVLFHLLQSEFLDKHKNEILEDLWKASEFYVNTSMKSRFLKQVLSKYNLLLPYLRDYNITVKDKIDAVSYRFGVNAKVANEIFNYFFNKYNLSNYAMDNLIFAIVFFTGEEFQRKNFSQYKSSIYTISIQKIVNKLKVLRKREGITVCGGKLCFTTTTKKIRGRKRKTTNKKVKQNATTSDETKYTPT